MRLSRQVQYALCGIFDLAYNGAGEPVHVRRIGERQRIPRAFLEQIFHTPTLLATIKAVGAQPELAQFRFRALNRWQQATRSRTRIQSFYGAGGEQMHEREFTYDADHPMVLAGRDQAPTPVEFLLHALATCLTAGIGNIAAARGVTLYEVESAIEGEIDLQGILGLSDQVRNGYRSIRATFKIKGDAPAEKLAQIIEQSRKRSAVYDVLTNAVPVEIVVNAG